jgi:DNA-binding XRE family transcriptional regulator
MRHDARLSLEEAAPRLDLTRSSLHRLETGVTVANVHIARSMMDLYDVRMPDLLEVIRAARRRDWWHGYHVTGHEYIGWEAGATCVYEVAALRVPDLLQTEDYTRHLLLRDLSEQSPDGRLSDEVSTRRKRQARLTDSEDPLSYTVILDESTLRSSVGSPDVMRAQLDHIAESASWPAVNVLVLAAGSHPRCGGFRLLEFDHPDDPPVLFADLIDSERREDSADLTKSTRQQFDLIASAALPPDASIDRVRTMADELYPHQCDAQQRNTA